MWQGQGGTVDGSKAGQDRRERRSSPSSTESCRSSTSLHRLLVLFPVMSRFQAEREAVEWGSSRDAYPPAKAATTGEEVDHARTLPQQC
jgi:hypothetical protein